MAAILNGGELTLTGDVGDFGFGEYFSHGDVVLALAQIEDDEDLTVFLNSGGGFASEGAAIHALLARREGRTDVVVDGVAASAASLIAMAGETVTMSAGSVLMIHDPSAITVGNSEEHAKGIELLEALAVSYARVYADKSGKSADECRAIMRAERWYAPDEAVAEGFADETGESEAQPVAAFDYRVYAHAPKELQAKAKRKNWRLSDASKKAAASAASHRPDKEIAMTDKERADQLAAENAELKTRAEAAEAKIADAGANSEKEELEQLRADKAARENTDAIMALEEAKGREDQAKALAKAGVKANDAKGILAAASKADPDEEYERQRLNGAGLNGSDRPSASANGKGAAMAANMRKLIGKEAN